MLMIFDQEYAFAQFGRTQMKKGIAKGEEKLAKLYALLVAAGREEEADKCMRDATSREEMYKEFSLADCGLSWICQLQSPSGDFFFLGYMRR